MLLYRGIVGSLLLVLVSLYPVIALGVGASSVSEYSVARLSREAICEFLVSQYVELESGVGCLRESPRVEPSVCYTSTNLLAEYVLRHVCGRSDLADKVKTFLVKYPTDFYDYYQILLLKPFDLPFTTVEHVTVNTLTMDNTVIEVKHVRRTSVVMEDYDQYANLLALKAVYHIVYNERDKAITELLKLSSLYDGNGFADKAYNASGFYETYKLALAAIAYRALGYTEEAGKYIAKLTSLSPLATYYMGNSGVGDLNVETACLVAIALYTELPVRTMQGAGISTQVESPGYVAVPVALAIVVLVFALWLIRTSFKRRT